MKRVAACIVLLLINNSAFTAAPAALEPIALETVGLEPNQREPNLLAQLAFPKGQRVRYQETQMNPMLKATVVQSGYVEITPDGAFIMQVTAPRPEQRRLENGKLSLTRPSKAALRRNPDSAFAKARTRTLSLNPEHGGHLVLLAITQVLSGDLAALDDNFDVISTPGEPWRVVLTPKSAKVKRRLQRLELLGTQDRLLSLYTQRSSDSWQRLTFHTSAP